MIGQGGTSKEIGIRRIAIIGAGAIGSTLGALLHRTGQNVLLIGRPAHVSAIRRMACGWMGRWETLPSRLRQLRGLISDLT
jgi:2-polyprenyl-6-methoxyphenol hydroxylase-like FAD-dependent oxidoreductase